MTKIDSAANCHITYRVYADYAREMLKLLIGVQQLNQRESNTPLSPLRGEFKEVVRPFVQSCMQHKEIALCIDFRWRKVLKETLTIAEQHYRRLAQNPEKDPLRRLTDSRRRVPRHVGEHSAKLAE